MTVLAPILQAFFTDRLMTQRAAVPHAVASGGFLPDGSYYSYLTDGPAGGWSGWGTSLAHTGLNVHSTV